MSFCAFNHVTFSEKINNIITAVKLPCNFPHFAVRIAFNKFPAYQSTQFLSYFCQLKKGS